MRQSGKTTRYVDDAIQMLFTKGSVTIVGDFSKGLHPSYTSGLSLSNVINTEEDIPHRGVLDGFIRIFKTRMEIEHGAKFITMQKYAEHPRVLYILEALFKPYITYKIIKPDKILK